MFDKTKKLMATVAGVIKTVPNQLSIRGHTDGAQYKGDNGYTNWELSADRANTARRVMQLYGVRSDQVAQIRGFADQSLRLADKPEDPSNRRISIIIQYLPRPKAPANEQAKKGDGHSAEADTHGEGANEQGKAGHGQETPAPAADSHAKPAAGH